MFKDRVMVKLENNEDMMILAIKIHKAVKAPVKLFNELLKKENQQLLDNTHRIRVSRLRKFFEKAEETQ
jgi:hypothetical protein